jgi:hypothetical protein
VDDDALSYGPDPPELHSNAELTDLAGVMRTASFA